MYAFSFLKYIYISLIDRIIATNWCLHVPYMVVIKTAAHLMIESTEFVCYLGHVDASILLWVSFLARSVLVDFGRDEKRIESIDCKVQQPRKDSVLSTKKIRGYCLIMMATITPRDFPSYYPFVSIVLADVIVRIHRILISIP